MKKLLLIAVFIAALAAVGIPFVSGMMMERTCRQVFADTNRMYEEMGSDMKLEITEFDRGFAASRIEWRLDLGSLGAVMPMTEIRFVDDARHGFDAVTSTTSLKQNEWYQQLLDNRTGGKEILHIRTRYPLTGDIESLIEFDGFSVAANEKNMDIQPGTMKLNISRGLDHFTAEGQWDGLSAGEEFSLSGVSMAADQTRVTDLFWQGDVETAVDRISVTGKKGAGQVTGLKSTYAMSVNPAGDRISLITGVSADQVESMGFAIQDAALQTGVFEIHLDRYKEMIAMYSRLMKEMAQDMDQGKAGGSNAPNDPQMKQKMQRKMAALGMQVAGAYEKLLTDGLEFQISELKAKLPQGDISGFLTLRLLRDMQTMEIMSFAMDPTAAFEYLNLKASLTIPLALVKNNPMLMSPPMPEMKTGLFIAEGDKASCYIETRDQSLYLNEAEVPLPKM